MSLKYYENENRRYSVAESIRLDFDTCADLTRYLYGHFNLKDHGVILLDQKTKRFSKVKKAKSWYSPATQEIIYHPSMLTPLTVAHEVAHYAHDMDRRRRYLETIMRYAKAKEANPKLGSFFFPKERWHGIEHRILVRRGIEALKTLPALQRYFAESPEGEIARASLRLQQMLRDRNILDTESNP